MSLIFHADDFGITPGQANKILSLSSACNNSGRLNSVSIFINAPSFSECGALLVPFVDKKALLVAAHLNIVEGPCCAPQEEIPLLVDERGMFKLNFIDILRLSKSLQNEDLLVQIAIEFTCQIERFLTQFPSLKNSLRLDSHQHVHMIPLVYRALGLALEGISCKVDHIRVSQETTIYLKDQPQLIKKIKPVNIVKTKLLSMLWTHCKKHPIATNKPASDFCGVLFSGHMEDLNDRALAILNQQALRFGRDVEVLYHPFGVLPNETPLDDAKADFLAFHTSEHRLNEANALRRSGLPV